MSAINFKSTSYCGCLDGFLVKIIYNNYRIWFYISKKLRVRNTFMVTDIHFFECIVPIKLCCFWAARKIIYRFYFFCEILFFYQLMYEECFSCAKMIKKIIFLSYLKFFEKLTHLNQITSYGSEKKVYKNRLFAL